MSATLLRPVTPADLPALFEHQRDPVAAAMAAFPPRSREAFDPHWAKILRDETVIARAIIHDDVLVGNAVSFLQHGNRVVGYWIDRRHWGRGIATRALTLLLEEIRERPLWAHAAKHNVGSLRVLEKCGFVVHGEGTIPGDDAVEELILIREE